MSSGASKAPRSAHFGEGNGTLWIDNVECGEGATDLSQCTHTDWGTHNCDHDEAASAVCLGTLICVVVLCNICKKNFSFTEIKYFTGSI